MNCKILLENSYMKMLLQALLNGLIIAGIIQFGVQAYQKHNARSLFLVTQAYPQFIKSANAVSSDYETLVSLESNMVAKLIIIQNIMNHNRRMIVKYQLMDVNDAHAVNKLSKDLVSQQKIDAAVHQLNVDLSSFFINANMVAMLLGVQKSERFMKLMDTFDQLQVDLNKKDIKVFVKLAKKHGLSVKSSKQYIDSLMSILYGTDKSNHNFPGVLAVLVDVEDVYGKEEKNWSSRYLNFKSYYMGLNKLFIVKL